MRGISSASPLVRFAFPISAVAAKAFRLVLRNLIGRSEESAHDGETHLAAALEWLSLAQDVIDERPAAGGVSAGWSFEDGWLPGCPETTGYIIATFIDAAKALNRPDLTGRAHRMIDWELSLQRPDRAFPGHYGEPGSERHELWCSLF